MRIRIFALILIFCLLLLISGLFFTQVVRHEDYRVMSEENRLKVIPLMAPRGCMYDREGNAVVKNELSFNSCVIYSQIKDVDLLSAVLGEILGMDENEIRTRMKKAKERPYTPYCIAQDVGIEKAIHLEEIAEDHSGLVLDVSARRQYVHGETASAIIGYLGLINRTEFERLRHYGYRMNDLVGRDGVERKYDNYLRGEHGGKQVEVDHLGRELQVLGYREPTPGKDVALTIDAKLQKYCDSLLEDKKGAVIVMDPNSGAILALASAPAYDPEIFINRTRSEELKQVLEDPDYPLVNRAIQGTYPPGSVFKVVVATAALELGRVDGDTGFSCNGTFNLGRKVFRCWYERGHGEQVMREAIKNSCNVFFYKVGLLVGADDLAACAERFGLGTATGVDLPGEKKGIVPTRSWKRKTLNERWYKGETVNYAIGQGYLLCTPMQIARMMSVFANKGVLVRPYIVSRVGSIDVRPREEVAVDISPETMEILREGLRAVVNDPRGTGNKARQKDVIIAGKTGTAQTSRGKSHGWFAGFAPFEGAKLTVVVFDEYGGKGGYYAAGTAGKVFHKAKQLGLL